MHTLHKAVRNRAAVVRASGSRTAVTGIVLAVTGALALSACGSGDSSGSGAEGSTKYAAVIKGLDNPFFQSMEQGIGAQAKAGDVSVKVQAANSITDTTGQADKLAGLSGQSYGCFIVNPISATNLVQGLAKVAMAKKTIVNIDNPIDAKAAEAANATPATYIGTDNVDAGKTAGAQMVKLLPQGGDVAVIGGIAGDVTSGARVDGFKQGIGSDLKVVQTVAADWDRQTALTAATDVMRAHPGLKGFFVANDDMGLGVARAIANAGRTGKVKVISVDGIKDALEAVKAGTLDATVAQYPYTIGQMGVEACQAAAKGKTLPKNVKAPVELVTKADADKALASTPKPFGSYDDPFTTPDK
ncbi:sugar ABC transporter substrate-binding protein [Streptomyces acidicola]|uniref:Substrate-binding domain-containing protein n=1 Tax=Streptomyces acidicola TaxID=2596892 RepID=A0A5N8X0W2_9ACTN|nr:substrate-binding domain-containing protein [Streptomyces acidicola]MPY53260.1 substrate-binding domain-containing protein [Streptomyces acidicola]